MAVFLGVVYRYVQDSGLQRDLPDFVQSRAVRHEFHTLPRRRRALGAKDLPAWNAQRLALSPVRREFHLLNLLTGSRQEQLRTLTWADVDFDAGTVHFPKPKGGTSRAYTIPMSAAIRDCLMRARDAGRMLNERAARTYVFTAEPRKSRGRKDGAPPSLHMVEHKEERDRLSHWGSDLRRTYKTLAKEAGMVEFLVDLLQNHAQGGVSRGYNIREVNRPDAAKVAAGQRPALAHFVRRDVVEYTPAAFGGPVVASSGGAVAKVDVAWSDLPRFASPHEIAGLTPRIQAVIAQGDDADEPYASRSEALFAALAALVRLGFNDTQIAGVVTDPNFEICAYLYDPKGKKLTPAERRLTPKVMASVQRQIKNARKKVAAEDRTAARRASDSRPVVVIDYDRLHLMLNAAAQEKDPEEDQKSLLDVLMQADPVVVIDNVDRPIEGATWCLILTTPEWEKRGLGGNANKRVLTNVLFIFNGNNIEFRGDMATRAVMATIDAGVEEPAARAFDVDLREDVPMRRGDLVSAALTVLRGHVVAGLPGAQRDTRFGGWSRMVRRDLLVQIACKDHQLRQASDPVAAGLRRISNELSAEFHQLRDAIHGIHLSSGE